MKINWKNLFLSWSILLSVLIILFIIQNAFLPQFLTKYGITFQLILPLLIYFFSQKNLNSSLALIFFTSLIAHSFSTIPFLYLFIIYFIIYLLTKTSYKFYFGNRKMLFFILLTFLGFLFPYLLRNLFYIFQTNFYSPINIFSNFFQALLMLAFGIIFYPFLNKFIKEGESF